MAKLRPTKPLDIWPETPIQKRLARSVGFSVPKIFSMIDNPDESLNALIQFRKGIAVNKIQNMDVDYSNCEKLDLCASALLDVLAIRAKKQRKLRNLRLGFSGTFSHKPEIDIMIMSTGILKNLGSNISRNIPPELLERLRFSQLREGRPSRPEVTSDTELAATDLAEFFDECLRAEKHQLKPRWKGNLIQLILKFSTTRKSMEAEKRSGTRSATTTSLRTMMMVVNATS